MGNGGVGNYYGIWNFLCDPNVTICIYRRKRTGPNPLVHLYFRGGRVFSENHDRESISDNFVGVRRFYDWVRYIFAHYCLPTMKFMREEVGCISLREDVRLKKFLTKETLIFLSWIFS